MKWAIESERGTAWCSPILVRVGVMDSHQTDRIQISQLTVLTTKPFKTLPSPHASKETEKSAVFPLAERPLLWRKHLLWPRVSALKTVVQFRDTQSSFKEINSLHCKELQPHQVLLQQMHLNKNMPEWTHSTTQSKLCVSLGFQICHWSHISILASCIKLPNWPATCLNSA